MTIGIYCIENLINGKKYIGKSTNIEKRWAVHKCLLQKEKHSKGCNRYLWSSVKKYGFDNFSFCILDETDEENLNRAELHWINFYKSYIRDLGYNLMVDSSTLNRHSEETKALMSKLRKGKKMPDGYKSHLFGKSLPEVWKEAISSGKCGKKYSKKHQEAVSEGKSEYSYQQYDLSGNLLATFKRWKDLCDCGFADKGNISAVCNGKRRTSLGYIWKKIPKIE